MYPYSLYTDFFWFYTDFSDFNIAKLKLIKINHNSRDVV